MKKISWALFLFYALTTCFGQASESDFDPAFKDGFYAGLSLGVNRPYANWSGVSSISLVDDNQDPNAFFKSYTPHGQSCKKAKITGSTLVGYQLVDEYLYLAGQIGYTLRSKQEFRLNDKRNFSQNSPIGLPPLTVVSGSSNIHSKVSLMSNELNLDLKPGIIIFKKLLLYGRAGAAFSRLKIRNAGLWTESGSEDNLLLQASGVSHRSKNVWGFRVGTGAEYLISDHLGISFDYIFTNYGKIRVRAEGKNTNFTNFNHVYGVSVPEVRVTTQTVMIGFVFHF